MIINTSTILKNARATANKTAMSGGTINIYSGTMPIGSGAITDQVLLATFQLPSPFGVVALGVFDAGIVLETIAIDSNAGAWARLLDDAGDWLMDVDVGATGSDAAIIADPVDFYLGGTVRINTFRLVEL